MTNRTEEKWPPADVLVQYLQEYAQVYVPFLLITLILLLT
jgi:hypothetical protein